MSTPLIGIPCRPIPLADHLHPGHGVPNTYVQSIVAAGGAPVLIPVVGEAQTLVEAYATRCDGFVFTGGDDVEPSRYGQASHSSVTHVSPARDELELSLFREIQKARKPTLAICRGLQLVNVACGGTLLQDIPSQRASSVCHSSVQNERVGIRHEIEVKPNTRLASILGAGRKPVNSYHHQCIKDLAPSLEASALSPDDGIIEAVESKLDAPWLIAVQWHPEFMWQEPSNDGLGLTWNLNLFKALVNACER